MRKFAWALLMALMIPASPILAGDGMDEIEFLIESRHPNVVEVEFYSQDENHSWPGNGDVYLLEDYNTKSFLLECSPGESICYGAWLRGDTGTYWGVGPDNGQYCTNCCYVCGATTEVIVLNP